METFKRSTARDFRINHQAVDAILNEDEEEMEEGGKGEEVEGIEERERRRRRRKGCQDLKDSNYSCLCSYAHRIVLLRHQAHD